MNKTERVSEQLVEKYEQEVIEAPKEEMKEAEKKPLLFYQRLLEQFCQEYYSSCFSGRKYHENSLAIDEMVVSRENWEDGHIVSWNMKVSGRHSFEGRFKNHNDSGFVAFVDELGDNMYRIAFYIKRYDIFGDPEKEEEGATRTITYSE